MRPLSTFTRRRRDARPGRRAVVALVSLVLLGACLPHPDTGVVLENGFGSTVEGNRVVYRAAWQAVTFDADVPLAPGAASAVEGTVPASGNTAYVLLAVGWDPSSGQPPTSFLVMQSRAPLSVPLNGTLDIVVDDATFLGDCDAGDPLTQAQADFITGEVFPDVFARARYVAAGCTTVPFAPAADAAAP